MLVMAAIFIQIKSFHFVHKLHTEWQPLRDAGEENHQSAIDDAGILSQTQCGQQAAEG